jgi:hypothetical protein
MCQLHGSHLESLLDLPLGEQMLLRTAVAEFAARPLMGEVMLEARAGHFFLETTTAITTRRVSTTHTHTHTHRHSQAESSVHVHDKRSKPNDGPRNAGGTHHPSGEWQGIGRCYPNVPALRGGDQCGSDPLLSSYTLQGVYARTHARRDTQTHTHPNEGISYMHITQKEEEERKEDS